MMSFTLPAVLFRVVGHEVEFFCVELGRCLVCHFDGTGVVFQLLLEKDVDHALARVAQIVDVVNCALEFSVTDLGNQLAVECLL